MTARFFPFIMNVSITIGVTPEAGVDPIFAAMQKLVESMKEMQPDVSVFVEGKPQKAKSLPAYFPVVISRQDTWDVYEQAASGYWAQTGNCNREKWLAGGHIDLYEIHDFDDRSEDEYHKVTHEKMVAGMMGWMYRQGDFNKDADDLLCMWDAGDYDCILQLAALGEITYG